MGQLRVAYGAPDQFRALTVQAALEDARIRCVLLCHEIPLQPGFTFELKPYADVLVTAPDLPQARETIAEVDAMIDGEADQPSLVYPSTINLRSLPDIPVAVLLLLDAANHRFAQALIRTFQWLLRGFGR